MYYNSANAYKTYEENNVTTADSGKLLLMLYDGSIKFCRFAEIALQEEDNTLKNYYLIRVQTIVEELMVTLNMSAGEIAEDLNALYSFMLSELIQVNIKNDIEKLKIIREMLEELRETWSRIM